MSEDSTLFRAAEGPTEAVEETSEPRRADKPDAAFEHTEMPPSLYKDAHKIPLAATLLEADAAYHTFDVAKQADTINDFIVAEIQRQKLPDTKDSYERVFREFFSRLNLPEDADAYVKVEKLYRYIEIQQKILKSMEEEEALLNTDPETLSSKKLQKYLQLKHHIERI